MRDLWMDREAAEADWQNYWEELQLDDHLIKLWEAAQVKNEQVDNEVLAGLAAGNEEIF